MKYIIDALLPFKNNKYSKQLIITIYLNNL